MILNPSFPDDDQWLDVELLVPEGEYDELDGLGILNWIVYRGHSEQPVVRLWELCDGQLKTIKLLIGETQKEAYQHIQIVCRTAHDELAIERNLIRLKQFSRSCVTTVAAHSQ